MRSRIITVTSVYSNDLRVESSSTHNRLIDYYYYTPVHAGWIYLSMYKENSVSVLQVLVL